MESTRGKILEILRRRHEATVDELTQALELAPATVRRHLDILQRDGYVSVRPVRRETGRPHYAFSLTEAGESFFPQHYMRITGRLVEGIAALGPRETAGKTGRELASLVFERMADDIARTYALQIDGMTLAERLPQTVAALAEEGLVFEVEARAGGYVLEGLDCPCRHIADRHSDVCGYDRLLLGRLLDADVQPMTLPEAGEGCSYLVQ
ncbi:MAG: ArsR family transcriptional regulator [Dehalococcoidia bacterium]|nr:ArsR family transcriptional regulator [Dehalococcoidia bacterium]